MNTPLRLLRILTLSFAFLAAAQDPLGDPAAGKSVFLKNCAICHGNQGRGDGPAAAGFNPRPADFTEARRLASTEERQRRVVTNGGASERLSPVMPAFGEVLSEQQVRDAVAFVREALQGPSAQVTKQ